MAKQQNKRTALLLSAAALGAAAFYTGLTVRHYRITSPKLKQSFRLAVLADLHSCCYGKEQHTLLRKILRHHPDAVMMVGDIYDDRNPPEPTIALLDGLSRHVPMYYVPGNHEYRTGQIGKIFKLFERYGVTILRDRWMHTAIAQIPVVLAGADDCEKRYYWHEDYRRENTLTAFRDLPTEPYTILLTHRPEEIEQFTPFGFDLVLNGHAHGGQVRLPPIADGLYAPGQGVFPRYTNGLYQHGQTIQVVSRGLSRYWYLPRICNPPEIVMLTVSGV